MTGMRAPKKTGCKKKGEASLPEQQSHRLPLSPTYPVGVIAICVLAAPQITIIAI